jgi:hypothetical protein
LPDETHVLLASSTFHVLPHLLIKLRSYLRQH